MSPKRSEGIDTQVSRIKTFQTEETSIVPEKKVLLVSSRTLSESVARIKLARRAGAEMRKEGQTMKAIARTEHCLQTGSHLQHF